jgi:predicted peptidase
MKSDRTKNPIATPEPADTPRVERELAPGVQNACELAAIEGDVRPMPYWLFLPEDYGRAEGGADGVEERAGEWPLLLFLHGAGERGDNLSLVKTHGPPRLVDDRPDFPFVVASPQCPLELWWDDDSLQRQLLRLFDTLVAELAIDERRIYLSGLSMGGYGVWKLATIAPHRFAAIAPICGAGDSSQAAKLIDMPIWAFHGACDEVVPQAKTIEMIEAIRAAGGSPKMTIYSDVAHNSWTRTYDNPELYEWLLMHRR